MITITDTGIGELDIYLFAEGTNTRAYEILGCHYMPETETHRFTVWAPHAKGVSVVGDFNGWNTDSHQMTPVGESGIWHIEIPLLCDGVNYKYALLTEHEDWVMRADPYAFHAELRPYTASKIWGLHGYKWNDANWMDKRKSFEPYDKPISIYEMHFASWRRKNGMPLFREIADELAEYLVSMGYTHVQLMPICEYPFDGSWGYQTTGYYAVSSRYGVPQDFMYFVDKMHQSGIGVILDWVPAHFPKDQHGLRLFDGTPIYEHPDPWRGSHPHWGTLIFDFGRTQVQSFLISNACFWMREFHVDGLRVDAVSSMLYLDYGKENGGWVPNKYGGNGNLEAIDFLKRLNALLFSEFPGALMIAEESTAWPMITSPVDAGGLGFNYKWNMGWMHDTLNYMKQDPIYRKWSHGDITFSMCYAYSENYILALSHDEVVHGKNSLLSKMPGDYWQKFASLRLLYGYMYAHPGKKLVFMGSEFGQFSEWNYDDQLDWNLLEYESHAILQKYVKALNEFYKSSPALYELDHNPEGFKWINISDGDNSVLAFARYAKEETLITVMNFTPVVHEDYRLGIPSKGSLTEVFNSDEIRFGGSGVINTGAFKTEKTSWNGFEQSIRMRIPPLAAVYLRLI